MNVTELRIGNYVNLIAEGHENEPDTFQWSIDDYEFYADRMHFVKPIPLTEECLIKFGFEREMILKLNGFELGMTGNYFIDNQFTYVYKKGLSGKVKYIHTLQNLYFALTQTELNYDN